MTKRRTEILVDGVRYPRFGWGRCWRCDCYRLLYYVNPQQADVAQCRPCLEASGAAADVGVMLVVDKLVFGSLRRYVDSWR